MKPHLYKNGEWWVRSRCFPGMFISLLTGERKSKIRVIYSEYY